MTTNLNSRKSRTTPRLALSRKEASVEPQREQNGYDGDALDRLADEIADRLAARLEGFAPARSEPLVDAAEIARMFGKTRSWVYEHAGELGAIRLGSGPKPRLAFSPSRVAESLEEVGQSPPASLPVPAHPQRRRPRIDRTATGAPLLTVRAQRT
jgi:hypothetical protein